MALHEKNQEVILSYSHQATDMAGQAGWRHSAPWAFLSSEAWVSGRTFGKNSEKKRTDEGSIVDQTEVRQVASVTRDPSLVLCSLSDTQRRVSSHSF